LAGRSLLGIKASPSMCPGAPKQIVTLSRRDRFLNSRPSGRSRTARNVLRRTLCPCPTCHGAKPADSTLFRMSTNPRPAASRHRPRPQQSVSFCAPAAIGCSPGHGCVRADKCWRSRPSRSVGPIFDGEFEPVVVGYLNTRRGERPEAFHPGSFCARAATSAIDLTPSP